MDGDGPEAGVAVVGAVDDETGAVAGGSGWVGGWVGKWKAPQLFCGWVGGWVGVWMPAEREQKEGVLLSSSSFLFFSLPLLLLPPICTYLEWL